MAKNKGKKKRNSKKGATKRAKRNKQREASHPVHISQQLPRDEKQTNHAAMISVEKSEASLRGGDASLPVDHRLLTFNPSTINAHDEGDQDVTLLDISPAKPGEERNLLFDKVSPVERRGINIFKIAPPPDHFKTERVMTDVEGQRSLEDVIADNPETRLSNLDEQTLAFAGHAVRQVVLEATYDFLQKCIPKSEQQRLWDEICGRGEVVASTKHSISIPDGIMDLKNGVRSASDLIGNCIGVISLITPVTDQKTLNLSLSRAVTLCDAVGDDKRKQALENAAHELNWQMLGLECKITELYRDANQRLDRVHLHYPVFAEGGEMSVMRVCAEQRLDERNVLQSIKWAHERVKEPFRVRFIARLQNLLAL